MAHAAHDADPAAITFRVGHILDYRDTAEIARILHELRGFGFVAPAELAAFAVPDAARTLPPWAGQGGR